MVPIRLNFHTPTYSELRIQTRLASIRYAQTRTALRGWIAASVASGMSDCDGDGQKLRELSRCKHVYHPAMAAS